MKELVKKFGTFYDCLVKDKKRMEEIRGRIQILQNMLIIIFSKLKRLLDGLQTKQKKINDISFVPYFPHIIS